MWSPCRNDRMKQLLLFDRHLLGSLLCSLMLITDKVENTMDHQKDDHFHFVQTESFHFPPGCFNRNDQIAEEVGVERGVLALPHRKSKDIGRFIPAEVSAIQFVNLNIVDQHDAELSIRECQFGQCPLGRSSYSSWV